MTVLFTWVVTTYGATMFLLSFGAIIVMSVPYQCSNSAGGLAVAMAVDNEPCMLDERYLLQEPEDSIAATVLCVGGTFMIMIFSPAYVFGMGSLDKKTEEKDKSLEFMFKKFE